MADDSDAEPVAQGHTRHLVLVHDSRFMDQSDFLEVARLIDVRAPDIRVFVVDNRARQRSVARQAAQRPSLVVCPFPLDAFTPLSGRLYFGAGMGKIAQMEQLDAAGIPVPRWAVIDSSTKLDPREWGPAVVVKPESGLQGRNVRMVPTELVGDYLARAGDLSRGRRRKRVFAQQFIDTGNPAGFFRVLSFMSAPLLCRHVTIDTSAFEGFDNPGADGVNIAVNNYRARSRVPARPPDVLDLARRAHDALSERPALGFDIVREAATGKLYVLEANPSGHVWHLSSPYARRANRPTTGDDGSDPYAQFDAIATVADVLIERTRREAQ